MKLSEVFNQLAYGELAQLKITELVNGVVGAESYPALIAHVNMGLNALFKRFNLKEGRVNIPLVPGTLTYSVNTPDVFKIERVYTKEGWELGLNDEADYYSCFTPSTNMLRVSADVVAQSTDIPLELKTTELEVVYRANHPLIVLQDGTLNPDLVEVELPYGHLEALLYFIASRVNNPIGMGVEFNAGNNWAAKYEQECQKLEVFNLRIDKVSTNTRLIQNGWV